MTAWHAGERAWHERFGIAERMAEVGPRVVRDFMPDQHRELFAELPFALLGTLDAGGQPRAVVLAGPEGFIGSPDSRTLELRFDYASEPELLSGLTPGMAVGLLGIQPHSRRRNRANGRVKHSAAGVLAIEVLQSFGNCPKYITPRHARYEPQQGAARRMLEGGTTLAGAAESLVARADTFFIASAASASRTEQGPPSGVDISHRGGPPGFVHLEQTADGTVLLVPDYVGNFFFNTLGNLTLHPRAGLLFLDHEYADVLAIDADAEIIEDPERVERFPGAQRLLELRVRSHRLERGACPIRWS